jgi:hypothetical protein
VSQEDAIVRLRGAFREFVIQRMAYDLEQGSYDDILQQLVDGRIMPLTYSDEINIRFSVHMIPNDVLMFRELAGFPKDDETTKRVWDMWRKEKRARLAR